MAKIGSMSQHGLVRPNGVTVLCALLMSAACATGDEGETTRPVQPEDVRLVTTAAGGSRATGPSHDAAAAGGSIGSGGYGNAGGAPGSGGSTKIDAGAVGGWTGTAGTCIPPAGPSGSLFFDDFEDGEYAACPPWRDPNVTAGGQWSVLAAADGSKVLAQTAAASDLVMAVSGDARWTDQAVQAKVRLETADGKIALFARVANAINYYYMLFQNSSSSWKVSLVKVVADSDTTLATMSTSAKPQWMVDAPHVLSLSVMGQTLTAYVDGNAVVTGTDASIENGGIGVGTKAGTAQFDDVTVTTQFVPGPDGGP